MSSHAPLCYAIRWVVWVAAGVGLLATNDLFNGMVAVLYLNTFYCTHLQTILAAMRSQVSLSNALTGAMSLLR